MSPSVFKGLAILVLSLLAAKTLDGDTLNSFESSMVRSQAMGLRFKIKVKTGVTAYGPGLIGRSNQRPMGRSRFLELCPNPIITIVVFFLCVNKN